MSIDTGDFAAGELSSLAADEEGDLNLDSDPSNLVVAVDALDDARTAADGGLDLDLSLDGAGGVEPSTTSSDDDLGLDLDLSFGEAEAAAATSGAGSGELDLDLGFGDTNASVGEFSQAGGDLDLTLDVDAAVGSAADGSGSWRRAWPESRPRRQRRLGCRGIWSAGRRRRASGRPFPR